MTRKARLLAAAVISIGIAVAAVLAYVLRDEVVVQYHLRKLRSSDEEEMNEAVRRLGELRSERALEALLDLARSEAPEPLRLEAVQAALRAGRGAAPRIKEGLDETDASFRRKALEATGKIEPRPEEVIPFLHLALAHDDLGVRSMAGWVIEEIGPAAESCIDPLIRALKDPVVLEAAITKNTRLVRGILPGHYHDDITSALASIGKPAKPAVLALLEDERAVLRRQALECLRTLIQEDPELVPVFEKALADQDPGVRYRAADSLWEVKPGHVGALQIFKQMLQVRDSRLRMHIVIQLGNFGPVAKDALPSLIQALGDENVGVRLQVLDALKNMGPEARSAITGALKDPDPAVRKAAAAALERLDKRINLETR